MTTPTLAEAKVIARATDRELHALGYTSADDARMRACEVLADEVERREGQTCGTCVYRGETAVTNLPSGAVIASAWCYHVGCACEYMNNGCRAHEPRT